MKGAVDMLKEKRAVLGQSHPAGRAGEEDGLQCSSSFRIALLMAGWLM